MPGPVILSPPPPVRPTRRRRPRWVVPAVAAFLVLSFVAGFGVDALPHILAGHDPGPAQMADPADDVELTTTTTAGPSTTTGPVVRGDEQAEAVAPEAERIARSSEAPAGVAPGSVSAPAPEVVAEPVPPTTPAAEEPVVTTTTTAPPTDQDGQSECIAQGGTVVWADDGTWTCSTVVHGTPPEGQGSP